MSDTTTGDSAGLRRTTGVLFVAGAVLFAGAATVLSSTFDWPDILREPADVVLPSLRRRRPRAWCGSGSPRPGPTRSWPCRSSCCPGALGRLGGSPSCGWPASWAQTSVLLSLIGFLRWVCVVPPLARSYMGGDAGGPRLRWRRPGPRSTSTAGRCSESIWASCWRSAGRSP